MDIQRRRLLKSTGAFGTFAVFPAWNPFKEVLAEGAAAQQRGVLWFVKRFPAINCVAGDSIQFTWTVDCRKIIPDVEVVHTKQYDGAKDVIEARLYRLPDGTFVTEDSDTPSGLVPLFT